MLQAGRLWLDETRVVKLSTIEGYSQLTTSCAYLGISYDEQPTDEVYSVMSGEEGEGKFNKVKETYKLSLLDENLVAKIPYPLEEFVEEKVLYSDQELQVCQYTPRYLPLGSDLMIRTVMKRTPRGRGNILWSIPWTPPGSRPHRGSRVSKLPLTM